MKNFLLILVVIASAYIGYIELYEVTAAESNSTTRAFNTSLRAGVTALDQQDAGQQVQGSGVIKKILPDDNKGSRHQRFILELPSGQSILIAHNIDLAPRVSSIKMGDVVEFNGVYELNNLGGVVHWTHHDPSGHHIDGWLKHQGKIFQ